MNGVARSVLVGDGNGNGNGSAGENAHNGAPLVLQEDIRWLVLTFKTFNKIFVFSSESSMGVNGSLKAEQQDDTRPSKFLDEVLDELDELR